MRYDGGRGVGRREGVGERSVRFDVAVSGRNLVGPSSGPMSCRATKHVASTRPSVHFVSLWQGCGGDPGAETTAEHSRSTASGPQSSSEGGADGARQKLVDDRRDFRVSGIHEDVPPRLRAFGIELSTGPEDVALGGDSSRTRKTWSRRARALSTATARGSRAAPPRPFRRTASGS